VCDSVGVCVSAYFIYMITWFVDTFYGLKRNIIAKKIKCIKINYIKFPNYTH